MRNSFVKISLLACLCACAKEKPADEIIVEGNIKNMPDGKVYLADGNRYEILLDSAECKDGHFRFTLKPDSSFIPSLVSIHYTDTKSVFDTTTSTEQFFKRLGHRMLLFHNYTISNPDSLRAAGVPFSNGSTAIVLDKGHTRIEGDARNKDGLMVFDNRETDVMFSLLMADFGWLGNIDGEKRAARIKSFKKKIRENPYSYYLIKEIYNAKEQYSEQELREILALFNPDVQASAFGAKVKNYLANRVDPDQPLPNLPLAKPDKQQGWMMDNGAKVNMLVFWASWCGPCRKEIPQLKELYSEYKDRGVNLVSVSIDEQPESWQKALGQEQMGWQQLIVDKKQIESVQQKFNFSAIPLVILADSRGKGIRRFVGYAENNPQLYRAALDDKVGVK
ncbi:thioredoxin-like domain-containing protein [Hymenobacter defluvii]|uniref:Redoxin domain-containing protein n=1 Tax=Hymenobacter defluvii TaxID=2054411 RepID=A0ABS3T770_9BACT|nr:thioredoxin-like domain-containing protein [Hymenobacter defluvii]MBO3269499.1 redoxin domain-containing protein [Hymenobacter defluvii]